MVSSKSSTISRMFRNKSTSSTKTKTASAGTKASKAQRLNYEKFVKVTEQLWKFNLDLNPEEGSMFGLKEYNDKLSHPTVASAEAHKATCVSALAAVNRLFPSEASMKGLSKDEIVNIRLFTSMLEADIKNVENKQYAYAVNSMWGPHSMFATIHHYHDFNNSADYEIYLKRIEQIPRYLDELTVVLRDAASEGVGPSRICLNGVGEQIRSLEKTSPSVFHKPLETFDEVCSGTAAAALKKTMDDVIVGSILPAFTKFGDFIEYEYQPLLSEETCTYRKPNGEAAYKYHAQHHTTTNMTPEEIHQLGLEEVARILGEMTAIANGAGFEGEDALDKYAESLNTNSAYVAKSEDELLAYYRATVMNIYPQLPKLFKVLPRTPMGVEPVPPYAAETAPGAYYQPPQPDSTLPGIFYLNCSHLEDRKKYIADALVLHEAIPGHHFQLARQFEIENMLPFRQFSMHTAYAEGWALYAESLGKELNMYQTPELMYGRLCEEMLRATRLVVDTGIHAKGWTKQEAMDYMFKNKAATMAEIDSETTRYIGWPGQALAYKVGELTIRRLRTKAETALGAAFDIREFHEVCLAHGTLPMNVLEEMVDLFIEEHSI